MSKITLESYNNIKEKYGNVSSWAIWSEQTNIRTKLGMGDISFFENPTEVTLNLLDRRAFQTGTNRTTS